MIANDSDDDKTTLRPEYREIVERLRPEMEARHRQRVEENRRTRENLLWLKEHIDELLEDNARDARVLDASLGPDRMRGWEYRHADEIVKSLREKGVQC